MKQIIVVFILLHCIKNNIMKIYILSFIVLFILTHNSVYSQSNDDSLYCYNVYLDYDKDKLLASFKNHLREVGWEKIPKELTAIGRYHTFMVLLDSNLILSEVIYQSYFPEQRVKNKIVPFVESLDFKVFNDRSKRFIAFYNYPREELIYDGALESTILDNTKSNCSKCKYFMVEFTFRPDLYPTSGAIYFTTKKLLNTVE